MFTVKRYQMVSIFRSERKTPKPKYYEKSIHPPTSSCSLGYDVRLLHATQASLRRLQQNRTPSRQIVSVFKNYRNVLFKVWV
jgi:hypothetical protein